MNDRNTIKDLENQARNTKNLVDRINRAYYGTNPHSIRIMAHTDPAALGYPVSCPSPHRTQIPRVPFLRFWEGV